MSADSSSLPAPSAGYLVLSAAPASAATITVTTTVDENGTGTDCSLREAIQAANTNLAVGGCPTGQPTATAVDFIGFNIPGTGTHTIEVAGSQLPTITEQVTIDGTTDDSYSAPGPPAIVLDGSLAGNPANGLTVGASGSLIKALSILDFTSNGIDLSGSGSNSIHGMYVGVDPSGAAHGNANGIVVASPSNIIGTSGDANRNVVSGNAIDGVILMGNSNALQNNYIGVAPDGTTARGNGGTGVLIQANAASNVIGGSTAGQGNVISANIEGVVVFTESSTGSRGI